MRGSGTSTQLPAVLVRRRNAIVASAVSSVLFVAGGVFIHVNVAEVANDDILSVTAMTAFCLAPFLGLPAALMGARDLKRIRRGIVPSSFLRITKWGQLLGVIGTIGNTFLLLIFVLQALSAADVDHARDSMMADLDNLFLAAFHFRNLPDSAHGGAGSYAGFVIKPSLAENAVGFYKARVFHPDTIQFIATWRDDPHTAISVKVGPAGKPAGPWILYGEFGKRPVRRADSSELEGEKTPF